MHIETLIAKYQIKLDFCSSQIEENMEILKQEPEVLDMLLDVQKIITEVILDLKSLK